LLVPGDFKFITFCSHKLRGLSDSLRLIIYIGN
jgi:hypothetical protein